MADTKLWKKRVEAWRASGLSSTLFCAGQDFTPGGLRYWAHCLRAMEGDTAGRREPMRLARVVRASTPSQAPRSAASGAAQPEPSVMLEAQGVRIKVRAGFDAGTLASVLDVLERRSPMRPS